MIKAIRNYFTNRKETKLEKQRRDEIAMELPEFVNELVLLLNAGMVVTDAVSKIALENKSGYFAKELADIAKRMKDTNSPFASEFREFARRSGSRELLRLSNIITDNMNKGSELVEKLEQEAGLMWHMSKKQVEEKGRLAESKLTFPMALMLISLILVTAAPAFMIF